MHTTVESFYVASEFGEAIGLKGASDKTLFEVQQRLEHLLHGCWELFDAWENTSPKIPVLDETVRLVAQTLGVTLFEGVNARRYAVGSLLFSSLQDYVNKRV